MRLSRTVALLLAIVLAATLSQALVSPSQASGQASHVAAKKPKHDLIARGTEIGNTNHFVVYGTITTYPKVFLFRKVGHGAYRLYRKLPVNNKDRFRTRIFQFRHLRTCFKVGAPKTANYAQTVVAVGCIVS